MIRTHGLATLGAVFLAAAGCGYPTFQFGTGGAGGATTSSTTSTDSASTAGGAGGTTSSTTSTTSSTTSSTASTTSSTTSTGAGGAPCALDHLVISEIRTRGMGGGDDEFVELYNPTSSPVQLDGLWALVGRKSDLTTITGSTRWTGKGDIIPAKGHFLITGGTYAQSPAGDDTLSQSLTDAASLTLVFGATQVDSVCFYYDGFTLGYEQNLFYPCEGMPVFNPHDDTTGTNVDKSIERKPGGALGNCTDTDDNSSDFSISKPSTPQNSMSPPPPG